MIANIPHIWVPIVAVCCYIFLMVLLLAAKKDSTIRSFMWLLLCFSLWTSGSLLMRLQIFPSYEFWYNISLTGLFALPYFAYNFIYNFIGAKDHVLRFCSLILTIAVVVLAWFNILLAPPAISLNEAGQTVFTYTTTWTVIIPSVVAILIFLQAIRTVVKGIKNCDISMSTMLPMLMGWPIVLVGNLLSIVPGNIFPFDTLSGIFFALLTFYSLYRKRLFRMTLLISKGALPVITITIMLIPLVFLVGRLEQVIGKFFPFFQNSATVIIAAVFSVITMLFYLLVRYVFNRMFLKEDQIHNQKMKDFSVAISKSLDLNDIISLLVKVVCDTVQIKKVCVCIKDAQGHRFVSVQSTSLIDKQNFSIMMDNPVITWFNNKNGCMMIKDFQRTALYKSMWDAEKTLIKDLGVFCVMPLKCDDELVGLVFLGAKPKGADYNFDDIGFLESAQSVASVSIKNARMYKQARIEAITDQLTSLLNRNAFLEELAIKYNQCKDTSIALIILNLDDFKLFNQLYGTHEGDMALKNMASIIKSTVGDLGVAGRYGGKEFAIMLPNYDMLAAYKLAERIRERVSSSMTNSLGVHVKALTLSGGVCVAPYSASNVKELVENTDMAVYNAKRSGKNKILTYTMDVETGTAHQEGKISGGYEEYAATIFALTAAIDAKDHYTFNHSQNVAKYATSLAKAAGLNEDHVQIIYEAALLHDIGKIAIPESILRKPGKLDAEEYNTMKTHVEHSIAIVRHLPSLDYVIPAAIGHHERWDGKGYPRGIAGEEIPIGARCLAIADSFDAMTSERSYKSAYTIDFACEEILINSGRQFDPNLGPLFVELINSGMLMVSIPEIRQA